MTSAPAPVALDTDIARHIWQTRYREDEADVAATWRRLADALAAPEPRARDGWARRFLAILEDFRFLPGGRIQAGAGTARQVTLFNCFVMGTIPDSMPGIFEGLKEGALTMQAGGGVGYDFSTLRPKGMPARTSGTVASGPLSFMHVWDAMCATLLSTGSRRGAMMGTLRCDHPDIEAFVEAKRDPRVLRHFNVSVLVTDDFMAAVAADAEWPLVFPLHRHESAVGVATVLRRWPGHAKPVRCRVHGSVSARDLWQRMVRAAYDVAEPGVLFIDRIRRLDPLGYAEEISATNPCGEIPLPPYGACDLGSINLTRFVERPFARDARLDLDAIADVAAVAVRLLDNVYEVSRFPLAKQARTARRSRRLGLGITGLADAFIMLGLTYGAPTSVELAGTIMRTIGHAAYRASIALAREKGPFEACDPARHADGEFVRTLPPDIVRGIGRHGLRNSHLTAIAPTGTISLLAGDVSSGLEPAYAFTLHRRIEDAGGAPLDVTIEDYAFRRWREAFGHDAPLPPAFVAAASITPAAQLAVQAALQPHVDNAISKTINVPADCPFDAFRAIYDDAWSLGLKGCAAFRPNPVTGSILTAIEEPAAKSGA